MNICKFEYMKYVNSPQVTIYDMHIMILFYIIIYYTYIMYNHMYIILLM